MAKQSTSAAEPYTPPQPIAADPPQRNRVLLGLSVLAWLAWLGFLIWLAWQAR
jgi:hypothetical protein